MNQVALITGAASGIGRQLAYDFARDGYRIAALDQNEAGLRSLADELGDRVAWTVTDVTDAEKLRTDVGILERRLGPTDLLIASAGVGIETSALNWNTDDITRVLQVNLFGVIHSIGAVLPGMIERKHGHIVGISSLASFRGLPRMLAYCASKSGVNAFLDGLRVEVKEHGIHVTTVCPGWIRTPMTEKVKVKMPSLMDVEIAARRIRSAIQKRKLFCAFPWRTANMLSLVRALPTSWGDAMILREMEKSKEE